MIKRVWTCMVFIWLMLFPLSCGMMSDDDENAFQENGVSHSDAEYPNFKLLEVFDGRGSLEEIWDSIEAGEANPRLSCSVNTYTDEFVTFSQIMAVILNDDALLVPGMLSMETANILGLIQDETPFFVESPDDIGAFYTDTADVYTGDFYTLLDKLWEEDQRPGDQEIAAMGEKFFRRMLDKKTPADIKDDMQELIDDINDDDFDRDFNLMASLLGKLAIQADYPLWVDGSGVPVNRDVIDPIADTNVGTGNAVSGMNTLINWLNAMLADDSTRDLVYNMIRESVKMFDPRQEARNADKVKTLLQNVEDHFTVGGDVYENDSRYKSEDGDPTYTDAEMGQTLREFLPYLTQAMSRSDRDISLVGYEEGQLPHYIFRELVNAMEQVGYDPNTLSIEDSLNMIMRYDLLGRDRIDPDSGAFPASMLESLLFLTCATAHFGFDDGGDTNEVSANSDPTDNHGHGTYTEALSLNDSLISMTTAKSGLNIELLNLSIALGLYDLTLKPDDKNYLFRSNVSFGTTDRANYKYDINSSYPILRTLASTCSGDYGHPDGGNRSGLAPDINEYRPYNPTGIGETQLAAWTMNWAVRSCFGGEGPYYYAPRDEALDPVKDYETLNGKTYTKYYRPDGRVYALVNRNADPWEYIYPTEEGDEEDPETDIVVGYGQEEKRQRFNRFKSTWHTDYYMYNKSDLVYTIDNSSENLELVAIGNGDNARRLSYSELISEDDEDHSRACASREEAFFRNYQWVYTEKKMVLIIPQSLSLEYGIGAYGVAFMVFEAHGWSGLANMRIVGENTNHIWAKTGTMGTSEIPGDFRVELVACDLVSDLFLPNGIVMSIVKSLVNEGAIYDDTLGRGHGTPAIVGKNLPALYRLGFPVSPEMTHGTAITDVELGSREFEVGDDVWQNRNALSPILISLAQAFDIDKVRPPDYDPASLKTSLRGNLNGFTPLLKPLIYYGYDTDARAPYDTWKMRVQGTNQGNWNGEPYLCPTGDIIDPATMRWDGSDYEWTHFQPAVMKTPLNILIDSDITAPAVDGKRMDGILPVITQNKMLTNLLKIMMSDANDSDDLYGALEQILGSLRYTEGTLTAINREDNASKPVPFPDWMFATGEGSDDYGFYTSFSKTRNEDLIVDIGLDRLLGHNTDNSGDTPLEGYGLACYVDEQEAGEWEEFFDDMDLLEDLLYPGTDDYSNPYCVVDSFINMLDAIFAREEAYTPQQNASLLYTIGKLFTRFDTNESRFLVQGETGFDDLYHLLKVRLPAIHDLVKDDTGDNYVALMTLNRDMLGTLNECGTNGLVPYLLDAMSSDDGAEAIINDIKTFITDDIVADKGPLWATLSDLLSDMATAVEASKDGTLLDSVYERYGFQRND